MKWNLTILLSEEACVAPQIGFTEAESSASIRSRHFFFGLSMRASKGKRTR
jgi:hypothetical protein